MGSSCSFPPKVTACGDTFVRILDLRFGRPLRSHGEDVRPLECARFDPDSQGTRCYTSSCTGRLLRWDVSDPDSALTFDCGNPPLAKGPIWDIAFAGRSVLGASHDGHLLSFSSQCESLGHLYPEVVLVSSVLIGG